MTIRLIIPGQVEALELFRGRLRGGEAAAPVTDLLDSIEVVHAFDLSQPARAAAAGAPREVEVEEDDLLEIEVEGGLRLWTSARRYQERMELWHPEAISDRGLMVSGLPGPSYAERGVKEWFAGALRVLRLKSDDLIQQLKDPDRWAECVKDLALEHVQKAGAWATAKLLMYLIEKRLTPAPGLYRWAGVGSSAPLDLAAATPLTARDLPKDRPILIFIHGTASRTSGSFGAFQNEDANQQWRTLQANFGEHIYAFEHRTLSESPIDNAVTLAQCLPDGAQVSLITHSRGGQVGDLLCLAEEELADERLEHFLRPQAEFDDADHHDRRQLTRLRGLLGEKHLRIQRVARVACPARGTLLASENIDEFLSLLTNLIGYIPGVGQSPIYDVIKRVTLQVVRDRTDPALIPGIEAMMPESPLVALLNSARHAEGQLGVVAGDIEGGNWLNRIAIFVTDRFIYDQRDNDLVVNTDSMFYGARREQEYYVFDQGSDVSHFNYFRNARTRMALTQWLLAPAEELEQTFSEFEPERVAPIPMLRSIQKRAGLPQPVVFVLPGIMGSSLEHKNDCIWLDYFDLMFGGLGKIKKVDDPNVRPTALLGEYYQNLCDYLSDTHEVLPFAYDWRKSIGDAAAALAREVEHVLERTSQPVRFVAHSMGGLVVRRFIADHSDLWEHVCTRQGSRFVMLGTPNRGSYAMVESLIGAATTVRHLALLDLTHSLQRVLDIVGGFPGALELLPRQAATGLNWHTEQTWRDLKQANDDRGAIPSARLLTEAQRAITTLPDQIPHVDRVLYVAGSAPMTPCGAHIERGRVVLSSTDSGDGRVTYESGKLPGVKTWYAAAEHGDLADHKPAFPAIGELLEQGKTTLLKTTPPSVARGEIKPLPYVPQPVLYPTRSELIAGFMGKPVRAYRRREPVRLSVCVMHGDLRYATHPVMVGHYQGDTIIAAEARLDNQLGHALSRRYQLGVYPGSLGSTAIIERAPNEVESRLGIPHGAIVIGLGRMGELGTGTLTNAVREGALQYALQTQDNEPPDTDLATVQQVGISTLLIGVNSAASITLEDSVGSLIRAIAQANRELERAGIAVRINQLEIIELFSDIAAQAVHAALRLAPAISLALDVNVEAQPELVNGRNGRIRSSQLRSTGSWRRWAVTAVSTPPAATALPRLPKAVAGHLKASLADPSQVDPQTWRDLLDSAFTGMEEIAKPSVALRYVAVADRARTEVSVQQRQPELVDKFVQRSISDTRFRPGAARTLCELLLPNEFKDSLGQLSRLVVEVDGETANYPWELLVDGGEPLCVKLGFVRQLETTNFRKQIRASTSKWAYVVGDPVTSENIPELPGARAEAGMVADLLTKEGYSVKHNPQRPGALDVLNGLFAQPYRLLHLAGHGYYEAAAAGNQVARSGMVLEGGIYLTAVEIQQMRQVPDLVFLNCCYLAQMEPQDKDINSVAYNKLAASISRELIEMGVRAVVAAGWAVRDDAASEFAKVFYSSLFNGLPFGDALQRARKEIWEKFSDSNTWGAYQAYGDPDFRLIISEARIREPGDRKYVAVEEVIYDLRSIQIESQELSSDTKLTQGEIDTQKQLMKERLEEIHKNCLANWLAQGELLYRFARVYGELGDFETAIEFYRQALTIDEEDSRVSITAAEQLANFEARLGQKTNNLAMIRNAIARLDHVIALGRTRERLALLGSAYKRLALVSTDNEHLVDALSQSASHYREATELGAQSGQIDSYHALNWITIEALLGNKLPDAESWLARCEAAAIERYAVSHKLWDAVGLPDAEVVRRLLRDELTPEASEHIISLYRNVFNTAKATPREQDSVVGQLDFIGDILTRLGTQPAACNSVNTILQELTGKAPPTPAVATSAAQPKAKGSAKPKKKKITKEERKH